VSAVLSTEERNGMPDGVVLVVGGTAGLGREVAAHYQRQGRHVVITGRDPARARAAAAELGDGVTGIGFDLGEPTSIPEGLRDVGPVSRLVLAAIYRDNNPVREYDVPGAINLTTMKLVGYPAVVHALLDRLSDDSSVVLFGGRAKDRPYPGSTTVTTVNGGVSTMIRTLAIELKPIRFNAIHPGIVGDSPFWDGKPLDHVVERTPTGRLATMAEVVDATVFLLENRAMNGVNLYVDGGWMLL
jgi:NAD(P)-dependent dehydrogenase (short-subunit alcohol dehydrogenase family)